MKLVAGMLLMVAAGLLAVMQALMFPGTDPSSGSLFFLWSMTVVAYFLGGIVTMTARGRHEKWFELNVVISSVTAAIILLITGYHVLRAGAEIDSHFQGHFIQSPLHASQ